MSYKDQRDALLAAIDLKAADLIAMKDEVRAVTEAFYQAGFEAASLGGILPPRGCDCGAIFNFAEQAKKYVTEIYNMTNPVVEFPIDPGQEIAK